MQKKYILAIDQGTTSSRAVLFNFETLEFIHQESKEYPQIYPKPGWVEHNLNDIWDSVSHVVSQVIKKSNINSKEISCIGITNQRETTCAYTRDGRPLHNAIVWQDRRTSAYCEENKSKYEKLKSKTGLPLDPYFSGTKIKWLLENSSEVSNAQKKDDLLVSTIDGFLLYKLTGKHHVDSSNASRTLLMDIGKNNWSKDLLNFFHVPANILPEIKETFGEFGKTKGNAFLPDGIPVTCLIGDQQSALFGQGCVNEGELKCTYGTGAFLLVNTGEKLIESKHGLLGTIAYTHNKKVTYALEGSAYIAGAAVQWLRDNLNFVTSSSEVEALALKAPLREMEFVTFLPFFSGIGSPHWKSEAKATITGLSRDTKKSHIARACLEGIALSICDLIIAMEKDIKKSIKEIKVDGGATKNKLFLEIQANFLDKKIQRPKFIETTVFGSALGAKIGLGEASIADSKNYNSVDLSVEQDKESMDYYNSKKESWQNIIKRLYL